MSCRHQGVAILLCTVMLQGCQNSSSTESSGQPLAPTDDSGLPHGDGDGSQLGDGDVIANGGQAFEDPNPVASVGPEGDSSLSINGQLYPLKTALGDIWGVTGEHFNVNFSVSNGKYRMETMDIDGQLHEVLVPAASSAIFYAEMFSPGDQFSQLTYSYSPFGDGDGVLAGNAFFADAYVGIDEDLSGDVEDDEKQNIVGGTIDFIGALPAIELHFSVTLEDGQLVEGHYTGLFDFTSR